MIGLSGSSLRSLLLGRLDRPQTLIEPGDNFLHKVRPGGGQLFESFITPNKKRRYIELLDSARGRKKIRFGLDHFADLDPRFCHRIKPSEQHIPNIFQILRSLGAPPVCYVISSGDELDGREMDLSKALRDIIGRGAGAFVSCLPGKLAYFESDEKNERNCWPVRPNSLLPSRAEAPFSLRSRAGTSTRGVMSK